MLSIQGYIESDILQTSVGQNPDFRNQHSYPTSRLIIELKQKKKEWIKPEVYQPVFGLSELECLYILKQQKLLGQIISTLQQSKQKGK